MTARFLLGSQDLTAVGRRQTTQSGPSMRSIADVNMRAAFRAEILLSDSTPREG